MKIKAVVTINLGLYMDIRSEIEIEVPDGLKNAELVEYLHTTYKGLLQEKESRDKLSKPVKGKSKAEKKEESKNTAELDMGYGEMEEKEVFEHND